MWPLIYGNSTRLEKIASVASITIFIIILSFILLPCGYYSFFYVNDINTKIQTFGPICDCVTICLKYCFLGLKRSTFTRCIRHIETDWKLMENIEHRGIMIKNAAITQKLTVICACLFYTSNVSYHTVMPLWSAAFKDNSSTRPLVYSGYEIFVDSDASPTYEFIYTMHCLYCCVISSVSTATCSLIALLTTHARGQMQVLVARMQGLVEVEKAKSSGRGLGVIIENHVKIIR